MIKPVGLLTVVAVYFTVTTQSLLAQLPATRLDAVTPVGGAPGSTFEIELQGNDLDDVGRLVFSHEGISAEPKMTEPTEFDSEPLPVPNTFVVTIAPNVPPGLHEVRCEGHFGLSNSRRFLVDAVPQVVEQEPNNTSLEALEVTLPIIAHGRAVGNADVDWFRFEGRGGERVTIRAEARTIDSRMEPRISLVDATGNTVVDGAPDSEGEARIDVRLPGNGVYFVKIHDATYQQGDGYLYRLCIGAWPRIESVFPPAIEPGKSARVTVYGFGLPGGRDSEFELNGDRLQQIELDVAMPQDIANHVATAGRIEPHQAMIDATAIQVGEAPFRVAAAGAPVVLEREGNDRPEGAQELSLPCEVAGRFYPRGDVDWFTFQAEAGEVWYIDVVSNRLGWPTDPALLVQQVVVDDDGNETIKDVVYLDDVQIPNSNTRSGRHEFDIRTTDPTYRLEIPASGRYRIFVRDAAASARNDARWTYRLTIRQPQPDFRLVAVPGESAGGLVLRPGGRDVVRVSMAQIDGFDGEVRVSATGLPNGVTCEPIIVGSGAEMGTLVLTAAENATPVNGAIRVTATATINGQEVTREARYGQAVMPWNFQQPNSNLPSVPARLMDQLQVSVVDVEQAPLTVALGDGGNQVFETCRGGILKIPYQVTRRGEASGTLQGFWIDVPLGTNAQQANLSDTGELELRFNQQTPAGDCTIYLAGFNQNMKYERYPESTERIVARQESITQLLTDAQQQDRDRTTAAQQAAQMLQQRTQEATAAEQALNQAKQQLAQAEQAVVAAENEAKRTAEAAAAAPEDTGAAGAAQTAATALENARKVAAEAKAKLDEAQAKLDAAVKARDEATTAKQEADQALTDAKAFVQRAQQEKQRADQAAQQARQRSNPRNINAFFPSNSITLRVAEYPIVAADLPAETTLKQGETVEVPVRFERKYEFTGPVNLQVQLPGGVGGIQINAPNIPGEQSEGKITFTVQDNATAGRHEINVRMQMNMNGANLQLDRPLVVVVPEKAPESEN